MSPSIPNTTRALLAVAAIVLCVTSAWAQMPSLDQVEQSAGTLFVVGFPDTTRNTFDARYPNAAYTDKAILFIFSAVETNVTVTGSGYTNSFTTAAGAFKVVELNGPVPNAPEPIVTEHCKPVDNTFRVQADAPIILYQYLVTKFGTEAWTPLPVEAWGTEYYAATMPGEIGSDISMGGQFDYNRRNTMFPAEILVMAAYDNTRITIVPEGLVHTDCNVVNITLQAGEAFQIQSLVDTLTANVGNAQPDFAGSRIYSTKPIGVISGNTRAQLIDDNVGLGKNSFKNMQIEWLAPVEQHGTEFVYMPTWDSHRPTGLPLEDPSDKRKFDFVRVYGPGPSTPEGYYLAGGTPFPYGPFSDTTSFAEVGHKPNIARVHRTELPAQAMMSVAAVVKYAGTTGGGGYIGAAFDAWGGYMVELTPREQWVGFAPFYASTHPAGMEHFINVVTDTNHMNDVFLKTGQPFIFQRRMEGTNLIWGSMAVTAGVDNWLEGRNGARFAGFVYGGLIEGGHEEYRPGGVRPREEEPPGMVNGGSGDGDASRDGASGRTKSADGAVGAVDGVMAAAEYEEYLAIAYGYPLAPSRRVVSQGDSLGIETVHDCNGLCVNVESLNDNPVGLRSVRLDSAVNAIIVRQNPFPLTGAVKAQICVRAIDSRQDASATIVIKDKTGKVTRIPFTYLGERLDLDKNQLQFGVMTPGTPRTLEFTITNPLARALTIHAIELVNSSPAFTINAPTTIPITIAPTGTVTVIVEANPPRSDQTYRDTVAVRFGCSSVRVPVSAETEDPCVQIGDLDFGTMVVGQSKAMSLRISNDGGGVVTFNNPSGGNVLEWLLNMYEVSAADLARLKAAGLSRGQALYVTVTFRASQVGEFRDTAKLWASTRRCRDTSYWVARVGPTVSAPIETGSVISLGSSAPNPTNGITDIRFSLARNAHATLVVYDARGERVATLVDAETAAGAHLVRFDAADLPAGVYHYRLSAGAFSQSKSFVKK